MAKKPEMQFLDPKIIEMPELRMAVVRTIGDPNNVSQDAMKALFGALYKIKFSLKKEGVVFQVDPLRARWPNAHLVPKDQWEAHWAVPVPEDTVELVQKVLEFPVALETWQ